jgi:uncharacterized protein (DUF2062 family)
MALYSNDLPSYSMGDTIKKMMDNSQSIKPVEKAKNESNVSVHSRYLTANKIRQIAYRLKEREDHPRDIAMGMAIGVFIAVTPTIPFHTVTAVALAFVFRCSKAAAFIGVWFSNPVTIPFLYYGSYRVGMFFIGDSTPFDERYESIIELINLGLDVTLAMIAGGVILGIPAGLAAYFITFKFIITLRSRRK